MAVYLACDVDPPEISWDETEPGFHTEPLSPDELVVREYFSKPSIRFLGAHTGCSCGFTYAVNATEETSDETPPSARSVAELRSYLAELLDEVGELELFACWEGDQDQPPESDAQVSLEHFAGDSFEFTERQLLLVRRQA
jgi:hypothetical protein